MLYLISHFNFLFNLITKKQEGFEGFQEVE